MTAERLLLSLSVLAVGLFGAAIVITGGRAPSVLPAYSGAFDVLANIGVPKLGDGIGPIVGFVAGWVGRWVYCLPWAAIPRALVACLLGLRTSAIMIGLALGCTAILLLY